MISNSKYFEDVSLLITHYNRSKSLERLLSAFKTAGYSFYDVVVSDDGSKTDHINAIIGLQKEYSFTFVPAEKNGGLGSNINKGQDRIKSKYTLYVQEDFIPLENFEKPFRDGLSILESDNDADTVRFYSYLDYPKKKSFKYGFSEMIFDPWSTNIDKFPMYSDHPHLRRSNFFEKFGRYAEGKNPEKTEFDMMMSFLQRGGKAYLYDDYKIVFDQINTSSEPSTMLKDRRFWRNNNSLLLRCARYLYRLVLTNYSLLLKKY